MKTSYNIKQKGELFINMDSYFKYPSTSGKSNPSNGKLDNYYSRSWVFTNRNSIYGDNQHNNTTLQQNLEHMANYHPTTNASEKLADIPSSKLYELQAAIQTLLPPPSNNIPFCNIMRAYWTILII